MPLTIPENRRKPLYDLQSYDDSAFSQIVDSLASTPTTENPEAVAKAISPNVKGISAVDLQSLVGTIYALHFGKPDSVDFDKFASDIVETLLGESSNRDVTQEARLKSRLISLLRIEKLARAAKAYDLQTEHERTYSDARIISDIRPVFEADPTARPFGAVLNHILKIEYHHEGEHKEIFFALDSDDITELQAVLDRAKRKEVVLRQLVSNLSLIDYQFK